MVITWRHGRLGVFAVVVLDKILVAAVNVCFDVAHQIIVAKTVEVFIFVPMTVTCAFRIDLNNFCTYSHFDFLYCVEDKRAQAAVEAIEVYDVFEVDVRASEIVVGILAVVLERECVRTEAVVTNIEKVSGSLRFVIENEASLL